eukprot:6929348-Lingulodinium_polyedra.AAC.1
MGEAAWLSTLVRDVVWADVSSTSWAAAPSSVVAVCRQDCEVAQWLPHVAVTDAKSAYDVLSRITAGGRQDRRIAVELAI